MKLKTKLMISFCVIVFVPVLISFIAMMIMGNRQLEYLDEYGKSCSSTKAERFLWRNWISREGKRKRERK